MDIWASHTLCHHSIISTAASLCQTAVRMTMSRSICTQGMADILIENRTLIMAAKRLTPPPPHFLRQLSNQPHRLDVGNVATIQSAPLAVNRPIVVLLHGYTGHRDFSPNTEIRPGNWFLDSTISSRSLESTKIQAYLRDGDYNVISVDYRPLAPEPCYLQAVQNLPTVARCTAQLLDTLVERRRIALADIHVIGFSLGAQAAGMISNYVRSGRLQRITGGWWG